MKRYRICSLTEDGRVEALFHLACRDDLEALSECENICDESSIEIWDDARLVARIKAGNAALSVNDRQSL
jgi:hypothetical protein